MAAAGNLFKTCDAAWSMATMYIFGCFMQAIREYGIGVQPHLAQWPCTYICMYMAWHAGGAVVLMQLQNLRLARRLIRRMDCCSLWCFGHQVKKGRRANLQLTSDAVNA